MLVLTSEGWGFQGNHVVAISRLFQPSLRDWFVSPICSQDYVLGYSQPVPTGLDWESVDITQGLKPRSLVAVYGPTKVGP